MVVMTFVIFSRSRVIIALPRVQIERHILLNPAMIKTLWKTQCCGLVKLEDLANPYNAYTYIKLF